MAKIALNTEAELNLQMEALTEETEGHCDVWNVRHKQLLENDQYLHGRMLKDRGDWNSSTEYGLFELVRHNGACYVSIQPSARQEPSEESEYWRLLANNYSHPSYTARTGVPTADQTPAFGGSFTVTQPVSDATGHITSMNSRKITIPSADATTSAAGLMSAADKAKLNNTATVLIQESTPTDTTALWVW